jgi:hypothetical protein
MEKRSRCEVDDWPRSLTRNPGGESAHAMSGSARAAAPDHRFDRPSSESDGGGPGLEQDPYRDEGGEA